MSIIIIFSFNYRYRNGFVADRSLPQHSILTATVDPDDSSELRWPSNIEAALAAQANAQADHVSILAQAIASEESRNPNYKSRETILGNLSLREDYANVDSIREQAEDDKLTNKFPELSSVDMNGEEGLEYLVKKEEFEMKHPARKARQPTNKAAWKAFSKQPAHTTAKPTKIPEVDVTAATEEAEKAEAVVEESTVEEDVIPLRSQFEIHLDETQVEALKDIRARRERQRGISPQKAQKPSID
jgi:hypothetical protein